MCKAIQRVVILGGGSAGWLSALSFKRGLPQLDVTLVQSAEIPVIGVGESTTDFIPHFLHNILGLDRKQFYEEVRPSWKLGNKFLWGHPDDSHFHYTFDHVMDTEVLGMDKRSAFFCLDDFRDASHSCALMDRDLAPCLLTPNGSYAVQEAFGYHIPNRAFLDYLKRKGQELGVTLIEGEVNAAPQDASGNVTSLDLVDGRSVGADLFIDASGFKSLLIDGVLEEPLVSYDRSLFCDSAVIGGWPRDGKILPYTTAETMEHGWCWRIEFLDQVTRGYVFSSAFCDVDAAVAELKDKNPELTGDVRTVRFGSGRRQRYWRGNVAAIGNAAGFVEPLEATALHMIIEQAWSMVLILRDSNCRPPQVMIDKENERYSRLWDDIRDFLALHYKFNTRCDSPFWQHCRQETPLGNAEELVDFYRLAGPSRVCDAYITPGSIFGYNGYLLILVGQRVKTQYQNRFNASQLQTWELYREGIRRDIANTVPVREGLQIVRDPGWVWPSIGV
ncbi:MAG: tryptophan halogenase family protein [Pseudomonadota bacterium]|nr:tryptophan halogenase family protein [Pseudomonadota bacterium]